jgi:Raf kinase inhibitor-like YbhB/YbcL family protein
MSLQISSTAFENNSNIPEKYTCDGINVNPPLQIFNVPENAKSLALIVNDPDAPAGQWTHWLVWNIDPKTADIFENSTPLGSAVGINDFKEVSWGGPCPPTGNHQYQFKLYALDQLLHLEHGSTLEQLEDAMLGHVVDQAEYVGYYSRS